MQDEFMDAIMRLQDTCCIRKPHSSKLLAFVVCDHLRLCDAKVSNLQSDRSDLIMLNTLAVEVAYPSLLR